MNRITRPFQFLKLVAAGVIAVAVGIWLLADPNLGMRDAPPKASDYMAGVGALAVGIILLAFAGWVAFRRPSNTRERPTPDIVSDHQVDDF
jgi:hypothetical protein